MKRGLHGTHVSVEPIHLFRYIDEQAFRFNNRKITDAQRFDIGIREIVGKRLTYAELTGKVGGGRNDQLNCGAVNVDLSLRLDLWLGSSSMRVCQRLLFVRTFATHKRGVRHRKYLPHAFVEPAKRFRSFGSGSVCFFPQRFRIDKRRRFRMWDNGGMSKSRKGTPKKPARAAVPRNPLAWLRGLGFVSMAIGGVGLMSSFFWPSVGSFYLGLAVLSIDLWFERLIIGWKILLWLFCLSIGLSFSFAVVLRSSPLSISYCITDTGLVEVYIKNGSSNDDYQDMDMTFATDSAAAHFDKLRNMSDFPSLSVIDQGWQLEHMEEALIYSDGRDYYMTRPTMRVRCAILPRKSSAHVLVSVVKGSNDGIKPALDWGTLTIVGHFKGRFRELDIFSNATRLN